MRDFENIDTNAFKAFWIASETLNFTEAAKQAAMTQSGISQHVSRLESQLGAPLFLRVNKKVLLTDAGKKLKAYIENYLDGVEKLKEDITLDYTAPTGQVSYAMPESCLMSPHFGLLLTERKKSFPDLGLKVAICPSEQVIDKVMKSEVNFGFVTKIVDTPGIKLIPFCLEEYVLVGGREYFKGEISPEAIMQIPFIGHPGVETYFSHWSKSYFPKIKNLTWSDLNIMGEMGSLKGVIDMVEHGLGITVIAEHCIRDQLKAKSLRCLKNTAKKTGTNQIYIATLEGAHLPKRVHVVINTFLDMVRGKP